MGAAVPPAPEEAPGSSPFAPEPPVAEGSEPAPPVPSALSDSPPEPARFKLKPKGVGDTPVPPGSGAVLDLPPLPPTPPTGEMGRVTMPPFPVVASAAPPPIHLSVDLEKGAPIPPVRSSMSKQVILKKAAIGFGVFAAFVVLFVGYRTFFAPAPKPVLNVVVHKAPVVAPPKPAPVVVKAPEPPPVAPPVAAPVTPVAPPPENEDGASRCASSSSPRIAPGITRSGDRSVLTAPAE